MTDSAGLQMEGHLENRYNDGASGGTNPDGGWVHRPGTGANRPMAFIYNLLCWPAAVLALPWLIYRALRGRLPGLDQRLGFLPKSFPYSGQPVVWVHAVSLGEVKAAAALLDGIRSRMPQLRPVMTCSTRTGWEAARQILPSEAVFFPPLDLPWICRRFLRKLSPKALLVMETELWPNLFHETKRAGAVLLLVNGRISDRAFPRYRWTRFLWRPVLALPDALFAQSTLDAERFRALGAPAEKTRIAGNLKYSLRPAASSFAETLRMALRKAEVSPVLVAGSTMPGEERYLLEAFLRLRTEFPRLWMILAPRHPERFASVAEEVRGCGIALQLRSEWRPDAIPELPGVLLLDSMGELGAIYSLATAAFVGGTLVATGGHNVLEPAFFARPVVIGPSMSNFREIAEEFLRECGLGSIPEGGNLRVGSIVQVQNTEELVVAFRFLFRNADYAGRLGEAARQVLNKKLAGVAQILDELERRMGGKPPAVLELEKVPRRAVVGAGNRE